jgi:Rrf2 family protein
VKLVPTRRTDYGIRAMIYLAGRDGDGLVKASEIADAMDIPMGFLHQVLQELQRARLVTSRPSRTGGYGLARDPKDISILQIIEALEGPVESEACALRGGPCHWEDVCALHWVWSAAQAALRDQLAAATLAQVAADDRALAAGTKAVPTDAHRVRTKRKARGGGASA